MSGVLSFFCRSLSLRFVTLIVFIYPLSRSWYERNYIKRDGFFRDVKFYAHAVTRRVRWEQPEGWKQVDKRAFEHRISIQKIGFTVEQDKAARHLQQLWRAGVAKRHLKLILRAERLVTSSKTKYESNPESITALCNYTLYLHAGLHNMEKAAVFYEECMKRMVARGGDHAFVLYSYAIFVGRTSGDYMSYVKRARAAEEKHRKRSGTKESIYTLANAYFRQVAIREQSVPAWHNYALCR